MIEPLWRIYDIPRGLRRKPFNTIDEKIKLDLMIEEIKAHSPVLAFVDLMACHINTLVANTIPDTGNVGRAAVESSKSFGVLGIATSGEGIMVGTGSTAVALADFALETRIADGAGAGELDHGVHGFVAPATSGTKRQFKINRQFDNNSGGLITSEEVGLYVRAGSNGATFEFMIEHTLLTIAHANAGTKVVEYVLQAGP